MARITELEAQLADARQQISSKEQEVLQATTRGKDDHLAEEKKVNTRFIKKELEVCDLQQELAGALELKRCMQHQLLKKDRMISQLQQWLGEEEQKRRAAEAKVDPEDKAESLKTEPDAEMSPTPEYGVVESAPVVMTPSFPVVSKPLFEIPFAATASGAVCGGSPLPPAAPTGSVVVRMRSEKRAGISEPTVCFRESTMPVPAWPQLQPAVAPMPQQQVSARPIQQQATMTLMPMLQQQPPAAIPMLPLEGSSPSFSVGMTTGDCTAPALATHPALGPWLPPVAMLTAGMNTCPPGATPIMTRRGSMLEAGAQAAIATPRGSIGGAAEGASAGPEATSASSTAPKRKSLRWV